MFDYPALKAVAAVVRTGSFEKAARKLNVTPSAVSQRIRHLEDRLGTALIVRATPCVATEKGEWLCRHIEQVEMLEGKLTDVLPALGPPDRETERVTLRIATNADSLGTWFLAAMADFSRHSTHLLDIAVDDQDHTAGWLRAGRVLAAVTGLEKPVAGCQRISLGKLRYHATASPGFVARHFPHGVTAEALAQAPALTFNQKDQLQTAWLRMAVGEDLLPPTHWIPSTQGFVEAAVRGMGWGMNPAPLLRDEFARGTLVELVPGLVLDVPLFWQVSRLAAGQLRDLTRAVAAASEAALLP